ncbi:hypothetical protein [Methanobrevibacter sp. DSM 116169]|uniref:hypothetical protein n=1 Tax=Methanobrevibacter sp. DSM 116169 TaxID=3242727 RepID=UPI0038FC7EF7
MQKMLKLSLLLILILFSVGSVVAEDVEIGITHDNSLFDDETSDVNNFTWLENEINDNDVVDLEGGIVKYNDTGSYYDGIVIDKEITIKNGVIDGNNLVRIFNIEENGFLTLENVILKNGNATLLAGEEYSGYGGAIYSLGQLTIINCTFMDNTARHNGGAICIENGTIDISDSIFDNNLAIKGGALMLKTSEVTIDGSTFINNKGLTYEGATGNGGAIYNNNATVTISNGLFDNNQVTLDLNNNYIPSGGAILNFGSLEIINTNFTNNGATTGGAIYNTNSDLDIINCLFENNYATIEGYIAGGAILNLGSSTLNLNDSTFNNNSAFAAGAIGNTADMSIDGTIFNNNSAILGGAIYNAKNLDIKNSEFTNNNATNGGAIQNVDVLTIESSIFENNSAAAGGAIINSDTGNLTVSYSAFYNNNDGFTIFVGDGSAEENNILSGNFWGSNDPTITNVIRGVKTLENYIQVDLELEAINNITYLNDNLVYNIVVKLNDSTPVDVDLLPPIVIDVNGTEYIVNKDLIENKLTIPLPNATGDYNLTIYFNGEVISVIEFEVREAINLTINLDNQNDTYGETIVEGTIDDLIDNDNITVDLWINGEYNSSVISDNGNFEFDLKTLVPGNYTIQVRFNGTNKYNAVNSTIYNLTINKTVAQIKITKLDDELIYYGDTINITGEIVGLKNSDKVSLNVTIDSDSFIVENVNGSFSIPYYITWINEWRVIVQLIDDRYEAIKNDTVINASKRVIDFNNLNNSYVFNYGNTTIEGQITNLAFDDVLELDVYLNGVFYKTITTGDNGTFTVNFDDKKVGNYTVQFRHVYEEYCEYIALNSSEIDLEIIKGNITVDDNIDVTINEENVLIIPINQDATGNITLNVNGTIYNGTIIGSNAIFYLDDLEVGNFTGVLNYLGDGNVNPFTTIIDFEVIKGDIIIDTEDIFMFYKDGTRYIAILTDYLGNPIKGLLVFITVNGVTYNRTTDENGTVSLNINLDPGLYNVSSEFKGNDKYNNKTVSTFIDIEPFLTAEDVEKYFRNGTQYNVDVFDKEGNPLSGVNVTFNINGRIYNRTSVNGTATLNINLDPGFYIITASYDGLSISNTILVKPIIETNNLNKTFAENDTFNALVLDPQGNPLSGVNVTFNINGRIYNRTTNDDGIAKLNINLDPREYAITTTYGGMSVSNNITVNPILIGYDLNKTFGTNDTYNVLVLDRDANPVTNQTIQININGVLYNRTSGMDGIVRLNINLDPNSYIATATWKGYSTSNNVIVV